MNTRTPDMPTSQTAEPGLIPHDPVAVAQQPEMPVNMPDGPVLQPSAEPELPQPERRERRRVILEALGGVAEKMSALPTRALQGANGLVDKASLAVYSAVASGVVGTLLASMSERPATGSRIRPWMTHENLRLASGVVSVVRTFGAYALTATLGAKGIHIPVMPPAGGPGISELLAAHGGGGAAPGILDHIPHGSNTGAGVAHIPAGGGGSIHHAELMDVRTGGSSTAGLDHAHTAVAGEALEGTGTAPGGVRVYDQEALQKVHWGFAKEGAPNQDFHLIPNKGGSLTLMLHNPVPGTILPDGSHLTEAQMHGAGLLVTFRTPGPDGQLVRGAVEIPYGNGTITFPPEIAKFVQADQFSSVAVIIHGKGDSVTALSSFRGAGNPVSLDSDKVPQIITNIRHEYGGSKAGGPGGGHTGGRGGGGTQPSASGPATATPGASPHTPVSGASTPATSGASPSSHPTTPETSVASATPGNAAAPAKTAGTPLPTAFELSLHPVKGHPSEVGVYYPDNIVTGLSQADSGHLYPDTLPPDTDPGALQQLGLPRISYEDQGHPVNPAAVQASFWHDVTKHHASANAAPAPGESISQIAQLPVLRHTLVAPDGWHMNIVQTETHALALQITPPGGTATEIPIQHTMLDGRGDINFADKQLQQAIRKHLPGETVVFKHYGNGSAVVMDVAPNSGPDDVTLAAEALLAAEETVFGGIMAAGAIRNRRQQKRRNAWAAIRPVVSTVVPPDADSGDTGAGTKQEEYPVDPDYGARYGTYDGDAKQEYPGYPDSGLWFVEPGEDFPAAGGSATPESNDRPVVPGEQRDQEDRKLGPIRYAYRKQGEPLGGETAGAEAPGQPPAPPEAADPPASDPNLSGRPVITDFEAAEEEYLRGLAARRQAPVRPAAGGTVLPPGPHPDDDIPSPLSPEEQTDDRGGSMPPNPYDRVNDPTRYYAWANGWRSPGWPPHAVMSTEESTVYKEGAKARLMLAPPPAPPSPPASGSNERAVVWGSAETPAGSPQDEPGGRPWYRLLRKPRRAPETPPSDDSGDDNDSF